MNIKRLQKINEILNQSEVSLTGIISKNNNRNREKASGAGIWDNQQEAQKLSQELSEIKNSLEEYNSWKTQAEDVEVLIELAEEEQDESVYPEIEASLVKLVSELEKWELQKNLAVNTTLLTLF